jgi:hypothetical protein
MKNSNNTIGNRNRDLPYTTVILTQPRRPQPRTARFAHISAHEGFWTSNSNCSWLSYISLNHWGIHSAFLTLTRIFSPSFGVFACLGYCAAFTDVSGQPIAPSVKGTQYPRSQKSKDLIYTAAAAWNSLRFFFWFVILAQQGKSIK